MKLTTKKLTDQDFPLYTKSDLAKRWKITIQRLNNWELKHDDFPARLQGVVAGDLPIYSLVDIKEYEDKRGGVKKIAKYNSSIQPSRWKKSEDDKKNE